MAGLTFKDWNSRMDLFADRQDLDDDDDDDEEEEDEDEETEEEDDDDSVWTPAYGFPYSTEENLFLASTTLSDTDGAEETSGANNSSTFVVLETIFEENSDDLQSTDSEVDCSYKSDNSSDEDDFESVIHISPGASCDSGSESERDVAVPKKRRKREAPPVPPRARAPSPEPAPNEPQSLSRSSSLLQFECLEQALSQEELLDEGATLVFRTSASDKPFSYGDSQPPSFSSFSFDSLDTNGSRRRCNSPLKDSLEEASTSSTAGCSSSSDDESYFLDKRHKLSGSFGRTRMRSYRSFDSLLHVVRPSRTSLNCVGLDEEEEGDEVLGKPKKSSENLSEDSGFGDVRQTDTAALPTTTAAAADVEPQQQQQEEDEVKAAEHMDKQAADAPAAARERVVEVSSFEPPTHPAVGEAVAELNLEEFEGGREAAATADDRHDDGHTHAVQEEEAVRADHHCWAAEPPRLTLVQFNSDLSVDQEEEEEDLVPEQQDSGPLFYSSAPNLLSEKSMSVVPVREPAAVTAWDMPPPREITEEVLKKDSTGGGGGGSESPKTSKSNRFGSFFQRFSFRKSKGKKQLQQKQSSQEDVTTAEAIHSVEQTAAELSNLEEQLGGGCRKERPPLPPVGPPKSRLLGIVGRRRPEAAAPGELGAKQKIDSALGSNGGGDETPARAAAAAGPGKKASSLVNITTMNIVEIDISEPAPQGHHLSLSVARPPASDDPRAKSMEFLLDDENKAAIQPPENELRKTSERKLSEHELRVQRSLQRLDVPDWYKNSPAAPTGSFLLNRRSSAGTSNNSKWPGLNSKTTSLSSLQQSPHLRSRHQTPSASSPSPVVSPSPQERHSFTYAPFSRWSTSRLNSASTSPSGSTRSSFQYRQPYLGWRSQEKLLANNTPTYYRSPAERLAATTTKPPLPNPAFNIQPPHAANAAPTSTPQTTPNNAEVRSSIKEVTSAIVHYVNEKNLSPARPGRSPSPRGSKTRLWVESSFVGSRPIDQPETPSMPDEAPGCAQPERMQTGGVIINHANGRLSNAEDEEEPKVVVTPSPEFKPCLPPSKMTSKYQQYININFNIEPSTCEDNASDVSDVELEPLLGPPGKPKLQDELKELLENFGNSSASPPSATIEDVLDSLLGLPTASRSPSPVISPGNSMTLLNSAGRHRDQNDAADQGRRSV
ncbi:Hypothetical predicted protein [Cloeon dipterum]|uniref:Uncharacterized protein n=1 Tax=Cloeon dipterum TaxID=197152 RepID=A0A8S1CJ34_9INSE|nr:Hypothetical predicted protein [Cloeon dipterum]